MTTHNSQVSSLACKSAAAYLRIRFPFKRPRNRKDRSKRINFRGIDLCYFMKALRSTHHTWRKWRLSVGAETIRIMMAAAGAQPCSVCDNLVFDWETKQAQLEFVSTSSVFASRKFEDQEKLSLVVSPAREEPKRNEAFNVYFGSSLLLRSLSYSTPVKVCLQCCKGSPFNGINKSFRLNPLFCFGFRKDSSTLWSKTLTNAIKDAVRSMSLSSGGSWEAFFQEKIGQQQCDFLNNCLVVHTETNE